MLLFMLLMMGAVPLLSAVTEEKSQRIAEVMLGSIKPFHFMLGKIYERQGMKAEAIRSYRTFLDLWREADAGIPEIEEANRSLAALFD